MANFIDEFFLNPIRYPEIYAPYNIVNTAVYAIIALAAVWIIYKGLERMKIKIDRHFFYSILAFVVFGGFLRVTEDADILPRTVEIAGLQLHPFVTPGIYVLVFLTLVAAFLILKALKTPKETLYRRIGFVGWALAAITIVWLLRTLGGNVSSEQIAFMVYILLLAAIPVLVFELIKRWAYNKRAQPDMKRMEQTTVAGQALDGAATFVGVSLAGYGEQHLVANTIFEAFGTPFAFYFLKMVFVIGVIFVLRKEVPRKEEHVYLLLLITLLGLAPGIRDAIRIFFQV
ncbi:DUF63 family protein [Candidatus Micrarchaeota archaeon]|nr:DUF63 family protein [Candidatus Micrarchaeota archaeon]